MAKQKMHHPKKQFDILAEKRRMKLGIRIHVSWIFIDVN